MNLLGKLNKLKNNYILLNLQDIKLQIKFQEVVFINKVNIFLLNLLLLLEEFYFTSHENAFILYLKNMFYDIDTN